MVNVYLFIGEDSASKYIRLKQIKEESLAKDIADFNYDVLYAKELSLHEFQEKLFCLPVKSTQRVIVIKDARWLKPEIREFLLRYVKGPEGKVVLVLDIDSLPAARAKSSRDDGAYLDFIRTIAGSARTIRFQAQARTDAFALSRCIESRKTDTALRILNQLLEIGEKPERILGGLRYSWQNDYFDAQKTKERMRLLLDCDIEIKTGRLKPHYALEKLMVRLCSSANTGKGRVFI